MQGDETGESPGIFDDQDWQLDPGDSLWGDVSGRGSVETTIDIAGIGAYFAVHARCLGDDVVVDVVYAADGPEDAFTPVCDGVTNRQRVYLDPADPVNQITIQVSGAGDWAVAVIENEEIAASVGSGG
ncbi:hypothetical protein [Salana multivorans]|uniref:hypothetical protein n=1 Tax=Salana multivorans TaxID=120377 RepID=UPI0011CDB89B|nr:hypothetical protein [Salana multivorans]